jgi:sugar lactone lactonase YvrE
VSWRSAFVWLGLTVPVWAATSTSWQLSGYSDLIKGRMSGLSLLQDGTLQPGLGAENTVSLNQPALWSVASDSSGNVYAATGHNGQLLKLDASGHISVAWASPQPEIFAICVDRKGRLWAGTSPSGGLYRIENGKATEVWHSPGKYIWALVPAPDGSLYVGTGEQGRVYRIGADGQAQLYFDTNQSNITALALGANGTLYAGTDPNGLLFAITAQGHGSVLYDSSLPEIRSIAVGSDGTVYAAGMGGAVSSRTTGGAAATPTTTTSVTATSPTVITVSEAKENSADDQQSAPRVSPDANRVASSNTSAGATAAATTSIVEVAGVEKSAIYKITADHAVETIRSSKEDNVYDLLLQGDSLIIATDVRGRVFRLLKRDTTMLAELGDGEATRLCQVGNRLFVGLSNPGRLIALGTSTKTTAWFESPVHDATAVARWGHLQLHGAGSDVVFRTRTGFAGRPDSTWSEWSAPIPGTGASLIASPPARYIQWRAEWPEGSSSRLNSVDIPFLPQNGPPAVHSVTVSSIIGTNSGKSGTAAAASTAAYSITVTDTGEPPAASVTNNTNPTVSRLQSTQTQISWQADDPDSDKLAYSIYFRAEEETTWQLVRSRMYENTLLLDPDVFADGRYLFRVVASDAPANAAEFAHETEMVSAPVLIDNTPPAVSFGNPARHEATLDVDIDAADQTSALRLCEVSLDAGSWQPLEGVDGVTDSPKERFHLHLEKLRPGEHLIVVRVYDAANNAGLARLLLR